MTCRELTEVITEYLEGELSLKERLRFRWHLGMCRHCRRYIEQMRETIELSKDASNTFPTPELDADTEAELLLRFRNWRK